MPPCPRQQRERSAHHQQQVARWLKTLPAFRAKDPASWPPKNPSAAYDWDRPTDEAYAACDGGDCGDCVFAAGRGELGRTWFAPTFSHARRRLDYAYHLRPVFPRQALQDTILSRVVGAVDDDDDDVDEDEHGAAEHDDRDGDSDAYADATAVPPMPSSPTVGGRYCDADASRIRNRPSPRRMSKGRMGQRSQRQQQQQQRSRPWLVFTAGPMGVGKGYVLSTLHRAGLFPLGRFLKIDPDLLKAEIPEMAGYLRENEATAATKVHRESTQMADVLLEHALDAGVPALVDGSLRDVEHHKSLIRRVREERPEYRVGILSVTADREAVLSRARARAERSGRWVPPEVLEESIEQVPRSVSALTPEVDVAFVISNDDGGGGGGGGGGSSPALVSMTRKGETIASPTWDDFANVWTEQEHPGDFDVKTPTDEGRSPGNRPPLPGRRPRSQAVDSASEANLRASCRSMTSCWSDRASHEAARAIWSEAYPNFCPRCFLSTDSQCGMCVHGAHLCGCDRCGAKKRVGPKGFRRLPPPRPQVHRRAVTEPNPAVH